MQRYFVNNREDNYMILDKDDMHHVKNVMRMKTNDVIECVYKEKVYLCKVLNPEINKFEIVQKLDENNEMSVDVTVAVALVKEKKMDLILQKLTELGVSRIIPVDMERSIVRIDSKKFKKKKERWEKICKEASEQSKRNKIHIIDDIKKVSELNFDNYDLKAVCSVSNKDNLVNKYLQNRKKCAKMIFVIGSEGGITESEEKLLNSMGYDSISLGNRVLRVETAAIYIASVVSYNYMG